MAYSQFQSPPNVGDRVFARLQEVLLGRDDQLCHRTRSQNARGELQP